MRRSLNILPVISNHLPSVAFSTSFPAEQHRIALVALGCVASYFQVWNPLPGYDVIAIATALLGGYPVFKESLEDLKCVVCFPYVLQSLCMKFYEL